MGSSSVTWLHTPEILTTDVRGTGHALCNACARVGAGVCPFVVNSGGLQGVGWVMAAFGGVVCAAVWRLPESLEHGERGRREGGRGGAMVREGSQEGLELEMGDI